MFSTFSDALHCLFGVHSKIDLSFLYLMRQETMMPCIDLSPSFMKMHLPLKVNLIAQPVQGINLQPLWLLLILTYHQRIFSSFLDTISINASISNSIKKIILHLLTFGIIFSRPLWHLTSWWITLSIGFVNSHRADWWEIQQKMSQNISAIYKKICKVNIIESHSS